MVPTGSFMMGSRKSDEGRLDDEGPQRRVTLARPIAVGKFEVTRGEFSAFVLDTGYKTDGGCYGWKQMTQKMQSDTSWRSVGFDQSDRDPVVCVNWDDAKAYVAWLWRTTGKGYRLLSEAEWEYAARAGTTTPFSTGLTITSDQANFDGYYTSGGNVKGQYRHRTTEVGSFPANRMGLHDMHGNVQEWVEDCWHDNYDGASNNANAAITACKDEGRRVLRGGNWSHAPQFLRSAYRSWSVTFFRSDFSACESRGRLVLSEMSLGHSC